MRSVSKGRVMRILGLDPGTARTGFGLIERDGQQVRMIECGLLETKPGPSPAERLQDIAQQLEKLLSRTKPDAVAVEKLFFATNSKTAMAVAEARGVILATCTAAGLQPGEYTPLQIKQSVAAYGQASKTQVATMVCKLLHLKETPKPDDVTDSLAVALCHEQWQKAPLS